VTEHAEQWDKAFQDFFEAFKNYDEAGSSRRLACLRYLVLASMLAQSEIDPFGAPETKPYRTHPDVTAMTALVAAYQRSAILEFEAILRGSPHTSIREESERAAQCGPAWMCLQTLR
jgi:COP9 signalosome complex subunit 2